MPGVLERIIQIALYYTVRKFGWHWILYAILAAILAVVVLGAVLSLARRVSVATAPMLSNTRLHTESAAQSALRGWHQKGGPLLRKYLPAFLAAYIITAGLAVVLGRFDADAALIGCPAVAAGTSYFFNRLRRSE